MYEPKIIAFLCTWCSYTGADLAGTSRFKTPHNIRAIRVPCSGRVSPELVMKAFDQGADGVLVLGCHIGECHYDTGNHRAAKRMPVLERLMSEVGLEDERLKLDWVSASEGERFANLVNEFVDKLRALGKISWHVSHNKKWDSADRWVPEFAPVPIEVLESSDTEKITEHIRETARELLASNDVSCVIGYEMGPRGITRPAFIYDPGEADRLVWNNACTHNLTTYLHQKLAGDNHKGENGVGKVAVVVKPCDSRSLNVLMGENHLTRDQVYVIGVVCDGVVEGAGNGKAKDYYQNRCLTCDTRQPVVFDIVVGDSKRTDKTVSVTRKSPTGVDLDKLPAAERMEFWLSQFDRCIRCYACRQACPACNCPTCLYERDDSLWAGMNIEINEKRTFHLGRAYHLAGRCVGCDECERVCPMDIPIGMLNRALTEEVKATFGFTPGLTLAPSPIATTLVEEALK